MLGQARQVKKKKKSANNRNNRELLVKSTGDGELQHIGSIYIVAFYFASFSKADNQDRKQFNFPSHKKSINI